MEETKTVKDIFTTYDVIDGYIKNERGNSLEDIQQHVIAELKKISSPIAEGYGIKNLYDCLDYLSIMDYKGARSWPINYNWIACYYVTGGSEGYYFHVDHILDGKSERLLLGKTLIENRDLAAKINAALGEIFQV